MRASGTYKSMSPAVANVAGWVAQQRANKLSNVVTDYTGVHPVGHGEALRQENREKLV